MVMIMFIKHLRGIKEFKPAIIELFSKAQRNVKMVSSLHIKFYSDSEVERAMEDCINRITEDFRLLVTRNIQEVEKLRKELPRIFELKRKYPKKFSIRFVDAPIRHFIVVDDKFLRIEEWHPPGDVKTETTNNIIMYAPYLFIGGANEVFEEYWKRATEVNWRSRELCDL